MKGDYFYALIVAVGIGYYALYKVDRRLTTLESRPAFQGYLYSLNEQGTWARVRSTDLDICRSHQCSVFLEGNK